MRRNGKARTALAKTGYGNDKICPSSSGIARSDAEEQRNCKEQRRAETDPNCGARLGRAWQRHGTEEPSDGMARKDNATALHSCARAQRSGAVLAMSSNGKEWL
jgi:hypothetical protein